STSCSAARRSARSSRAAKACPWSSRGPRSPRSSQKRTQQSRTEAHMSRREKGFVVWFTGLSGAGKSTITDALVPELRAAGKKVEVLDGDVVRTHLSKGLGFSREDRDTNIARIAFVAHLLARNGVAVLVAAISPFKNARDDARAMIGPRDFVEVHVAPPLEACIERDVKGLYKKAL